MDLPQAQACRRRKAGGEGIIMTHEELSAIEEIKQLKSSYFRALDTKDWVLIRKIFSAQPSADYRGAVDENSDASGSVANAVNSQVITDLDMLADGLRDALAGCTSIHLGANPEIQILSSTTAKGIWAMQDWLWFKEAKPRVRLRGHGHYHNSFVVEDGVWKIKTLRLTRQNVEITQY